MIFVQENHFLYYLTQDIWEKIIVLGGGKIISKLPSRKGSSLSSGGSC